MAEPIAKFYIEGFVDIKGVERQMDKVNRVVSNSGGLIQKNMLRNFNAVANGAKRMATQISFALKAFSVPALAASTLSVKKLFGSDTRAGGIIRGQFEGVKKSIDEAVVRIGWYITQSKIFGKTMLEWVTKFSEMLNRVTQRDVQAFITNLSRALKLIMEIALFVKSISFAQGFLKALEGLQRLGLGGAAGSAIGGAAGAAAGGAAGVAGGKAIVQYRDAMKMSKAQLAAAEADLFTPVATATVVTASIGSKLLGLSKLLLKWTGILTVILAAFDFLAGVISQITGYDIKDGLDLIMKTFALIGNFFESLSDTIGSLGRQIVNLFHFGKGWSARFGKEFERLGIKYNDTWGTALETESPETKALKSKEAMDKILDDATKGFEAIAKAQEKAGENAQTAFETAADQIMSDLQDRLDISKITKKVEEDRIKLEKELVDTNKSTATKIQDQKDNLEKERLGYSGQFVGGTELIKFQQKFQNDWSQKLLETNKNIAEINQEGNAKVDETNRVLKTLNDKFDKFFKYVNEGLNPADLAEGLGL